MKFNNHPNFKGAHAFLSPSKYAWTNYSLEKMSVSFERFLAIERGTELHALAERCIRLKIRLDKSKKTLNLYVNDAISFGMAAEKILVYSPHCFGTVDAISFRDNMLRIHDLKTGESPASARQLEIYAALFCLEYGYNPANIGIELRLYQLSEVSVFTPEPDVIQDIMDKIVMFDKEIEHILSTLEE